MVIFTLPVVAAPLGFRLGEWLEARLLRRLRARGAPAKTETETSDSGDAAV